MPTDTPTPEEQRLVERIFSDARRELTHQQDCFACSLAFEIVGEIAPLWDPLENWDDTPASDGLPGDTCYGQLERIVAYVLHRKLPGHEPAQAPKETSDVG